MLGETRKVVRKLACGRTCIRTYLRTYVRTYAVHAYVCVQSSLRMYRVRIGLPAPHAERSCGARPGFTFGLFDVPFAVGPLMALRAVGLRVEETLPSHVFVHVFGSYVCGYVRAYVGA